MPAPADRNEMLGQSTNAPQRHAAKLLRVKLEFSMRTLARSGHPIFTLKKLPARNVRALPVPAQHGQARLAPVTAVPARAVPARLGLMRTGPLPAGHTLIVLGQAVPLSSGQLLRTVPPQPGLSAAKAACRVPLPPAAASLAQVVRGQAASLSGPDQARAAGQTPAPATAASDPMEQSQAAVLPVQPGLTLRAPKANPLTAPPAQSPIRALHPAPREKPVPDGSPSPASVAPASPPQVLGQAPDRVDRNRAVSPNPATKPDPAGPNVPGHGPGVSQAERNADKNSPIANSNGAVSFGA